MPRTVDHDKRRRAIVEVVWRLLAEDDPQPITVRLVARESGWSVGTIQHYFPTQDDLLLFATREMVVRIAARIAKLDLTNPTRDDLTAAILEMLPVDRERRVEARVWFQLLTRRLVNPSLDQKASDVDAIVRHSLREVLTGLHGLGVVHNDRSLDLETSRLHALVDGLALHNVANPPLDTPLAIRNAVQIHLDDLRQPPGRD